MNLDKVVASLEETQAVVNEFSKKLKPGSVVGFEGDLGAGKTTFIQLLSRKLGVTDYVNSPTFTIINEYDAPDLIINHVDFYRIETIEDLYEIGIQEYFNDNSIALIEWVNLFPEILPEDYFHVTITLLEDENRRIEIR